MRWPAVVCSLAFGWLATGAHAQHQTMGARYPVIFTPTMSEAEFEQREELLPPDVDNSVNVASATRSPWLDTNGWQFLRQPDGKFAYDLPRGRAMLAAAEAFAYNADAILKIHPSDAEDANNMLEFLRQLRASKLPTVADIGVVDDGSEDIAEVMNLLGRRNLLYRVVDSPSPTLQTTVQLGTDEFPVDAAADPSEFAQMVRSKIGDANRSLRIYGTETVLCHLTGDATRVRLHLLNYGGQQITGLRVRLRGHYGDGEAAVFGARPTPLQDVVSDDTAIEFTIAAMKIYAVVDLPVEAAARDHRP